MTAPTDAPTASRHAVTSVPLAPVLAARWSPRAFDPAHEVADEDLTAVLEAARWAASAGNSQPWTFLVVRRGQPGFEAVVATLSGNNTRWAHAASALVVGVAARPAEERGRLYAAYGLGTAVAQLTVEAAHRDLVVHQMGGFDPEALARAARLPSDQDPLVVVALGRLGDPAALPDDLRERETQPRVRRPFADVVRGARWDEPAPITG